LLRGAKKNSKEEGAALTNRIRSKAERIPDVGDARGQKWDNGSSSSDRPKCRTIPKGNIKKGWADTRGLGLLPNFAEEARRAKKEGGTGVKGGKRTEKFYNHMSER